MSRWIRGLLLGCALVAIAATAQAATRGGKMIYARYADSLFLDPVFNDANVDIWILTNLYDTLLQPTADGKGVSPGLATAYQVSDDGLTFTLTLRQGTKFSDGSPITAEDVKGTLDRARNPKNGIWSFLVGSVQDVTTEGGVFVPRLWPEIESRREPSFDWERLVARRLLPLPIDHRYGPCEMEKLCQTLLQVLP